MKAEYKREMNRNYIVLDAQENDYQIKMLTSNEVKGILALREVNWDGGVKLYYDISAKQPMERVFSKRKIGSTELKEILYAISFIYSEAERLLLDVAGFIANPEYMYWDLSTETIWWLFYPYDKKEPDLTSIAEFVLEHVDNTDVDAVKCAYEFYKKVREQSVEPDRLYELISVRETPTEKPKNLVNESAIVKEETLKEENRKGMFAFLDRRKKKEKEEWLTEKDDTDFGEADKTVEEESDETVLVTIESDWIHRLISLDKSKEDDIEIRSFPVIIGTRRDCVDALLRSKSVSKMHAQLDLIGEKVVIRDLASKNGTFVDGCQVGNVEVELETGAEVCVGNVKFIFE